MNELLLSLVASPGGNDAITGVMAKAPPGESPPVTAASFLQILLQTIPAGQTDRAATALLAEMSADPTGATTEVKTDDVPPADEGPTAVEPEPTAISLTALGMAALAVALPTAALPVPQAMTPAVESDSGVPPATPLLTATKALEGAVLLAGAESPPEPSTSQGSVVQALEPEPAEGQPPEMNAEIPAPETREGSARIEDPRVQVPAHQATRVAEEKVPGVNPKSWQKVSSSSARGDRESLRQGTILRPIVLPENATTVTTEGRAVTRPVVLPSGVQDLQSRPADTNVSGVKAETPSGLAEAGGRFLVMDRMAPVVPEHKQAPEGPLVRVAESRRSEREGMPAADAQQPESGKRIGRAIITELLVMPTADEKPAAPAEPTEATSASGDTQAENRAAEPGIARAANAGSARPAREAAEPNTARHALGGIQGHQAKETTDLAATKDAHATGAKVHTKLTEELSRSVLDQVVKHVALQVRGEMSEIRIRLDPPSLGQMQVTVRMDEGRVQAQIDVTQPSVRIALESNVQQLRQTLADHGIEVHRIDVYASDSSMSRESHEGHGHRSRQRDGGRQQGSLDGVEQYRGARMMGYNTIEMVM